MLPEQIKPGKGFPGNTFGAQDVSRIADQWCACITDQGDIFAPLEPVYYRLATLSLIEFVKRNQTCRNTNMIEEDPRVAGIFGSDQIHRTQSFSGSGREVAQVADRRGDNIQRSWLRSTHFHRSCLKAVEFTGELEYSPPNCSPKCIRYTGSMFQAGFDIRYMLCLPALLVAIASTGCAGAGSSTSGIPLAAVPEPERETTQKEKTDAALGTSRRDHTGWDLLRQSRTPSGSLDKDTLLVSAERFLDHGQTETAVSILQLVQRHDLNPRGFS
ncbi:MAG: hypothetical protein Ct9H300mP16_16490 [Pseudomonadota bacterium]|nr:MAG: hypothetical protein Ct9H300mP16_16490 [Pseudomonadota bacterium]